MRLLLSRIFRIGRNHGRTLFAKCQLEECASSSVTNGRIISSFYAPPISRGGQQNLPWLHARWCHQQSGCGSDIVSPPVYKSLPEPKRESNEPKRELRIGKRSHTYSVIIPEEMWNLLVEYDALEGFKKGYAADITPVLISETERKLMIRATKQRALKLYGLLKHQTARTLELPEAKAAYMREKGPDGKARIDGICERTGIDIRIPWDKGSALLTGPDAGIDAAIVIIESLKMRDRMVPCMHAQWACQTDRGKKPSLRDNISAAANVCVVFESAPDESDALGTTKMSIVAATEDAITRAEELLDADSIVCRKYDFSPHQPEFLFGHTMKEVRPDDVDGDRPILKIQEETGTNVVYCVADGTFHVTGRDEGVAKAIEKMDNTRHIVLCTSVILFPESTYINRRRLQLESDDLQIHLLTDGMPPGKCEFRRLHRMDREDEKAKALKMDTNVLRKLDSSVVVLKVKKLWVFLKSYCCEMEAYTGTRISVTKNPVDKSILIIICGSSHSVKDGVDEVIRRITTHPKYEPSSNRIYLRKMRAPRRDKPFETYGFAPTHCSPKEDPTLCTDAEKFYWNSLTRDQWLYVGKPSEE